MKIWLNAVLFISFCGIMSFAKAQNLDSENMMPLASTTISDSIVRNGRAHYFHGSLYNPFIQRFHAWLVLLPPGYHQNPDRKYPVLYFMHGTSKGSTGNGTLESALYLYNQMEAGVCSPFIVVWPSVGPNNMIGPMEKFFFEIFIPHIEGRFRISPRPEHRAITGHSMGGRVATMSALKHPEKFIAFWQHGNAASVIDNAGRPASHYNAFLHEVPAAFADGYMDLKHDSTLIVRDGNVVNNGDDWRNLYFITQYMQVHADTLAPPCPHNSFCIWQQAGSVILRWLDRQWSPVIKEESQGTTIVGEDNISDTYTLVLDKQPDQPVKIAILPSEGLQASPDTLIFLPQNWNLPQNVTVQAQANSVADGHRWRVVRHKVISSDVRFHNRRVFNVRVLITDSERPTEVSFARIGKLTNPPFRSHSAGYSVAEHANLELHQFVNRNDTITHCKRQNVVLAVHLKNPHPLLPVTVTVKLDSLRLRQSSAHTPNFAQSADLNGFTDTTIVFEPGQIMKEIIIAPTIDQLPEGTELAQFSLACPSGGRGAVRGKFPFANVALSDYQIDRQQTGNAIIISEWFKGREPNDVAIELFNPDYRDVGSSNLKIKVMRQPGIWTDSVSNLLWPNGGSVRIGDVLVIGGETQNDTLREKIDIITPALNNLSGNEVIGLFRGNTLIDVIGLPGQTTTTGWTAGSEAGASMKTMIRKPSVFLPNANFATEIIANATTSQWYIEPKGYMEQLGFHIFQRNRPTLLQNTSPIDTCVISQTKPVFFNTSLPITLFPNPAGKELTLTLETDWQGAESTLINPLGRIIEKKRMTGRQVNFQVEHLSSGIYFIQVRTQHQQKTIPWIKL